MQASRRSARTPTGFHREKSSIQIQETIYIKSKHACPQLVNTRVISHSGQKRCLSDSREGPRERGCSRVAGLDETPRDPPNRLSLDRAKRILVTPIRLLMAAEMLEE